MLLRKSGTWLLIILIISPAIFCKSKADPDPRWAAKKRRMSEKVRKMFYHAYDNYMSYSFPHDELKPLTKTHTDSLVELGNLKLERLPQEYHGSALTLIESLSRERGARALEERLASDMLAVGGREEESRKDVVENV